MGGGGRRGRTLLCALWRALPTPPLCCRVSPSFSHHLFTPCSARLLRDRRSALFTPPTERVSEPASEPRRGAAPLLSLFFSTPGFVPRSPTRVMPSPGDSTARLAVRWLARACSHQRRIYLRIYWHPPTTATAITPPPPRTHAWTSPIVTEEERKRGENHIGLPGWGSTAL